MVGINIGDHGHHRLQMQEAGITFICFSNQVTASTQLRITARSIETSANHKGGIQTRSGKH